MQISSNFFIINCSKKKLKLYFLFFCFACLLDIGMVIGLSVAGGILIIIIVVVIAVFTVRISQK